MKINGSSLKHETMRVDLKKRMKEKKLLFSQKKKEKSHWKGVNTGKGNKDKIIIIETKRRW